METNQAMLASHKETLAKKLEGYERMLGKSPYLAGEKITLADLFHLPYGQKAIDVRQLASVTWTILTVCSAGGWSAGTDRWYLAKCGEVVEGDLGVGELDKAR